MTDDNRAPQFWINQQVEQRLTELRRSQEEAWTELRTQIRRGDGQANTLTSLEERSKEIRARVDATEKAIREDLLTRDDFRPYRNGIVAVITAVGMAVLGGILKLVVIPH